MRFFNVMFVFVAVVKLAKSRSIVEMTMLLCSQVLYKLQSGTSE